MRRVAEEVLMTDEREKKPGSPQITPNEREEVGSRRDPEERPKVEGDASGEEHRRREQAHDKTLADSFPTSDPPSTIPDPGESDAA
jgi:hypothetical protein